MWGRREEVPKHTLIIEFHLVIDKSTGHHHPSSTDIMVKHTEFYEFLGVKPDASDLQIRRGM